MVVDWWYWCSYGNHIHAFICHMIPYQYQSIINHQSCHTNNHLFIISFHIISKSIIITNESIHPLHSPHYCFKFALIIAQLHIISLFIHYSWSLLLCHDYPHIISCIDIQMIWMIWIIIMRWWLDCVSMCNLYQSRYHIAISFILSYHLIIIHTYACIWWYHENSFHNNGIIM